MRRKWRKNAKGLVGEKAQAHGKSEAQKEEQRGETEKSPPPPPARPPYLQLAVGELVPERGGQLAAHRARDGRVQRPLQLPRRAGHREVVLQDVAVHLQAALEARRDAVAAETEGRVRAFLGGLWRKKIKAAGIFSKIGCFLYYLSIVIFYMIILFAPLVSTNVILIIATILAITQ